MSLLSNRKTRNVLIQAGFVTALVGILLVLGFTAYQTMQEQGITSGFSFLNRSTGFAIGTSLIEFTPNDSYGRMFVAGILNTLLLGIISLSLANIIGLFVAALRISRNKVLSIIGTTYVEIFRNIPIILQALFWYAICIHLPRPKEAYSVGDVIFVSSRGIYLPSLNVQASYVMVALVLVVVSAIAIFWYRNSRRFSQIDPQLRKRSGQLLLGLSVVVALVLLFLGRIPDGSLVSVPYLKGLNFREGIRILPELLALIIAISVYGGAYICEIFRAGFNSVGKGQSEAGMALGLSQLQVFFRIRLPLAFRAVLPTLTNIYVWLFKATTLGIAVGFSDFFMVSSISITQSGQTMEIILLLMVGFLIMNNSMSYSLNKVNKAIALKGARS